MEQDSGPRVNWRDWGPAPFEEAAAADRPVLLSLSTPWCAACDEMDRTTYSDPRVVAAVHDGFVPVRVDADRRPRVRERYAAGGFPSTVFLTPSGELLSSAGYLDTGGMRQVLDRVSEAWRSEGADAGRIPRALREEPPAGEVTGAVEAHLAGQLAAQFDEGHGGWGSAAKFPLPATVEFALKRDRDRALRALDSVRTHLQGDDGGVARYAGSEDWTDVHDERLLDTNAAVCRAFAHAYCYTGADVHREAAESVVDYLTGTLWTGDAFGGSQAPDDADGEGAVDDTPFADRNALAASALLALVAYTDDERSRRYAERTLDFLREELVTDGAVAHYPGADGGPLLVDAARVTEAFATAAQVLGGDYMDDARAVADTTVDRLGGDGAFVDAPPSGPGLLDRPLRTVDDNAVAADALATLAELTGEDRYRTAARDALSAFAGATERFGVQVAGFGTAAARVVDPPLRVRVAAPAGSPLHRAALRVADHEKVVVPDADGPPEGTAVVRGPGGTSAPVEDPESLAAAVAERAG